MAGGWTVSAAPYIVLAREALNPKQYASAS